jgi:hypothetical protein
MPPKALGAPNRRNFDFVSSRSVLDELGIEEPAEHCGPSTLEIAVLLETARYQNLDSPLSLRASKSCRPWNIVASTTLKGG